MPYISIPTSEFQVYHFLFSEIQFMHNFSFTIPSPLWDIPLSVTCWWQSEKKWMDISLPRER